MSNKVYISAAGDAPSCSCVSAPAKMKQKAAPSAQAMIPKISMLLAYRIRTLAASTQEDRH